MKPKSILYRISILFLILSLAPVQAFAETKNNSFSTKIENNGDLIKSPAGLRVDEKGNLYVADAENHIIIKVEKTTGKMETIVGMKGQKGEGLKVDDPQKTKLNYPTDLAINKDASVVYIADKDNDVIRKAVFKPSENIVTEFFINYEESVKDNPNISKNMNKSLKNPEAVALLGNYLYICDTGNNRILSVNVDTGIIATVLDVGLKSPRGVLAAGNNNLAALYVSDTDNNQVLSFNLDAAAGIISNEISDIFMISDLENTKKDFKPIALTVENLYTTADELNPLYVVCNNNGVYKTDTALTTLEFFSKNIELVNPVGIAIFHEDERNNQYGYTLAGGAQAKDIYFSDINGLQIKDTTKPYVLKDSLKGNLDEISLLFSEPIKTVSGVISALCTRVDFSSKLSDESVPPYPTSLNHFIITNNQLTLGVKDLNLPENFLVGIEDGKAYDVIINNIVDFSNNSIEKEPYEFTFSKAAITRPSVSSAALTTLNDSVYIQLSFVDDESKPVDMLFDTKDSAVTGSVVVKEYNNNILRKTYPPITGGIKKDNGNFVFVNSQDIPFDLSNSNKSYKVDISGFQDKNGLEINHEEDLVIMTGTQNNGSSFLNRAPEITKITPSALDDETGSKDAIFINTSGFKLTFTTLIDGKTGGVIELLNMDDQTSEPMNLFSSENAMWTNTADGTASELSISFPEGSLQKGTNYSLTVDGFKSVFNKEMKERSLLFRVSENDDPSEPKIAAINFKDKVITEMDTTIPISVTDELAVYFDKPMVQEGTVILYNKGVKQKPVSIKQWGDDYSYGGGKNSKAVIDLQSNVLKNGERYSLKFIDFAGNATPNITLKPESALMNLQIEEAPEDRFPPVVKMNELSGIPINTPITVKFDEPMSIENKNSIAKISAQGRDDVLLTNYTWDESHRSITFAYPDSLSEGLEYVFSISGFKDQSENNEAPTGTAALTSIFDDLPKIPDLETSYTSTAGYATTNNELTNDAVVAEDKELTDETVLVFDKELTDETASADEKTTDVAAVDTMPTDYELPGSEQANLELPDYELADHESLNDRSKEYETALNNPILNEPTHNDLSSAEENDFQSPIIMSVTPSLSSELPIDTTSINIKFDSKMEKMDYYAQSPIIILQEVSDFGQIVELTAMGPIDETENEYIVSLNKDILKSDTSYKLVVNGFRSKDGKEMIKEEVFDFRTGIGEEAVNTFQSSATPVYMPPESNFLNLNDHWAQQSIQTAVNRNLVPSINQSNFDPDSEITIAEFLTLLKDGLPELQFDDLTFSSEKNITREEAAEIIANSLKENGYGLTGSNTNISSVFNDSALITEEYKDSVALVVENNIMQGVQSFTFSPKDYVTKAQAVVLLLNAKQLVEKK